MHHIVARTVRHRLLFHTWAEGAELWHRVVGAMPGLLALCLMPDHLHLLTEHDVRGQLGRTLGGVARRRNHQEGRAGALFERLPMAVPVVGDKKQRRSVRYVHLNPCRARLADDPLAWPLSTHRDALGLTWPRVGPRRPAAAFHAYVSSDPTTHTMGTPLPSYARSADLDAILRAVSCLVRVPTTTVGRHRLGRALAVHAAGDLMAIGERDLAVALGISRSTLRSTPQPPAEARTLVARMVLDDRFGPIDGLSLLGQRGWERYARATAAGRSLSI